MPTELLILPFLGALIGWLTNRIAIRLLFYPRSPYTIPLLGWKVQGLLPKRRKDLARAVGETVEQELFSSGDLVHYLRQPHFQKEIKEKLAAAAADRIQGRLPAFVPRNLVGILTSLVRDFTRRELGAVLGSILNQLQEDMAGEFLIGSLVEKRLLEIDLKDLEDLIFHVVGQELVHIEVLGGILGFLIGIFQAAAVVFLG